MMKKRDSERGSALMLVTIIVLILVGISGAYMSVSWYNSKRAFQDESATQALYIAESGAAAYLNALNAVPGSPAQPQAKTFMGGGFYWVPTENLVDFGQVAVVGANNLDPDYCSFQVAASYNGVIRRVDVLVTHKAGGVFWNAIFAGDSRGEPGYSLNLTGDNLKHDTIKGDIYTGGNLNANGTAVLQDENGNATGAKVTYEGSNTSTVTGPTYAQGTQPPLSIPRTFPGGLSEAEYKAKNANTLFTIDPVTGQRRDSAGVAWIDVAGSHSSSASAQHTWVDGSRAGDIMDVNDPSHIFRKNPSSTSSTTRNRTARYEQTINPTTVGPAGNTRNDYYLEDPTNGSVQQASLTGVPVNGDTNASMINVNNKNNKAVYFIDGNMRVSGEPIKSYQLKPDPAMTNPDLKMTFIVKGNVSLTDNMLYPSWESTRDTVAFIAIEDPLYPNTTAAMFGTGQPTTTPLTPYGVSIDTFIAQYNARANTARGNGLNMPDIILANGTAEHARASQEYNKIYGSGNVFFGDPGSGTVEHFEAYMYAENNFYATNLDTSTSSGGTGKLEIYGNMTAGNQVSISRSGGAQGYIPLNVTFNPNIKNGIAPPGLPATPGVPGEDWKIVSWKQSGNTAETVIVK